MNPFYFSTRERALFGVYHPPRRGGHAGRGVVLCYPFGVEYMRAHRAFRQMTSLLVKAGVHVLRFDYFGTGDSAGSGTDVSLTQWRADVAEAVMELRETAGLREVTLVGLRLGAALAVEVAAKRDDIEGIVAWDPVVSGAAYLEELLDDGNADDERGIGGFPLTSTLTEEIRALDLASGSNTTRAGVHLVVSREEAAFLRLREHLGARGRLEGYQVVPSEGGWVEGDPFGSVLLPGAIVQTIVHVVAEGRIG